MTEYTITYQNAIGRRCTITTMAEGTKTALLVLPSYARARAQVEEVESEDPYDREPDEDALIDEQHGHQEPLSSYYDRPHGEF